MQLHSLTVHCITRPGQILCLVGQPRENWPRMIQLLTAIPGGTLAKAVPLDDQGQVPPIYEPMVQKPDTDFILTIGDVPAQLVIDLGQHHNLPRRCIVTEDSRQVAAWRQSKVYPPVSLNLLGYDLAISTLKKGPSALPIPMAALTGEVPTMLHAQVVLQPDETAPHRSEFTLERILQIYRSHLSESEPEVPFLAKGNLQVDDLYILVGTGDDIADLFFYWNIRRVPVVREHGIWLPRHLFDAANLKTTLGTLHRWILRRDIPQVGFGGPAPWRPGLVKFVAQTRAIVEQVDELALPEWQWGTTTGLPEGETVHFIPQPLDMLLEAAGVKYGETQDILASVTDDRWMLVLPSFTETFGAGAVSELNHQSLANLPPQTVRTPGHELTRTFLDGIVVYRTPNSASRSEVVTLGLPSDWDVFTHLLSKSIKESDKAAPILALIDQAGGIAKCDFLEDQKVLDFLEDAALESVQRDLKEGIMSILAATKDGNAVDEDVDALVRKIGSDVRSQRNLWCSLNTLKKLGISEGLLTWLYQHDLVMAGLKLKCPTCQGSAYYQPQLLSDFRCSTCGWRGKAPLAGPHAPIFYRPRDLLLTVTAGGGLPVLLTMLRIHRDHPTARTYPGIKLQSAAGEREVDIVAWYEGRLYFYEVKHSGRQVDDALRWVNVAREYQAVPVFAAYEETRQLAVALTCEGVDSFYVLDLGKPVVRLTSDPWDDTPAWRR